MKRYAMGGKMNTKGAMGDPDTAPLSADVEADLQALKTLKKEDYVPSSGPKRRYARGKIKRYPDEGGEHQPYAKPMKKGGMARSSASKRADGIAVKGKTRGKMV